MEKTPEKKEIEDDGKKIELEDQKLESKTPIISESTTKDEKQQELSQPKTQQESSQPGPDSDDFVETPLKSVQSSVVKNLSPILKPPNTVNTPSFHIKESDTPPPDVNDSMFVPNEDEEYLNKHCSTLLEAGENEFDQITGEATETGDSAEPVIIKDKPILKFIRSVRNTWRIINTTLAAYLLKYE